MARMTRNRSSIPAPMVPVPDGECERCPAKAVAHRGPQDETPFCLTHLLESMDNALAMAKEERLLAETERDEAKEQAEQMAKLKPALDGLLLALEDGLTPSMPWILQNALDEAAIASDRAESVS